MHQCQQDDQPLIFKLIFCEREKRTLALLKAEYRNSQRACWKAADQRALTHSIKHGYLYQRTKQWQHSTL